MPRPGTIALIVFLMFAIAFPKTDSTPATTSASNEIFTDITEQAGITWQQFGGESQDRFLIETMGGGVGFFDFDNDGLLDIFFVNGGETPHGKSPIPLSNALYRNLGGGRFRQRRLSGPLYHRLSRERSLSQQSRRDLYRCHRQGRREERGKVGCWCSLVRLRSRWLPGFDRYG